MVERQDQDGTEKGQIQNKMLQHISSPSEVNDILRITPNAQQKLPGQLPGGSNQSHLAG